jgi:hypothetical protein
MDAGERTEDEQAPEVYEPGEPAPVDNDPRDAEADAATPDEDHPAAGGAGEPYHS